MCERKKCGGYIETLSTARVSAVFVKILNILHRPGRAYLLFIMSFYPSMIPRYLSMCFSCFLLSPLPRLPPKKNPFPLLHSEPVPAAPPPFLKQ